MTLRDHRDRLSWTALGMRMGYTSEQSQRDEILAAIDRMTWAQAPGRPPDLDGPAVRALVTAVVQHHRDYGHLVGVAQLDGGRQLIGLDDACGIRRFVLDLDTEVIYVLAQVSRPVREHTGGGDDEPCDEIREHVAQP